MEVIFPKNYRTFDELQIGMVFVYKGRTYIKTPTIEIAAPCNIGASFFNAVGFPYPTFAVIPDDVLVPVYNDAKFILTRD